MNPLIIFLTGDKLPVPCATCAACTLCGPTPIAFVGLEGIWGIFED